MPTERKYPTVWEVLHPGEPPLTEEEGQAMRERALRRWDALVEADPSILDDYQPRQCACCAKPGPADVASALPD